MGKFPRFSEIHSFVQRMNAGSIFLQPKFKNAEVVYCPPYTLLDQFYKIIKKSKILLGAQNIHHNINYGAYTGSINSKMIKDIGCRYVIIGHSENRLSGDTDKIINQKLKSSLKENLKVVFCFGETLKERKNNKTDKIIKKQINNALRKVKNKNNIIFAYEPVWSIGSGKILKVKDLELQITNIKNFLNKKFKIKKPKVLYGGSVNSNNILILKQIPSINGFLVGGSSLKVKKFIDIIKKTIN